MKTRRKCIGIWVFLAGMALTVLLIGGAELGARGLHRLFPQVGLPYRAYPYNWRPSTDWDHPFGFEAKSRLARFPTPPAAPAIAYPERVENDTRGVPVDESDKFPDGYFTRAPGDVLTIAPPGRFHSVARLLSGEPVYDVHYTIDEFNRRKMPEVSAKPSRFFAKPSRFLMMLGCSFLFGEGLEDDQTLPVQVARHAPGYRVYNYGFHGYSPSSLLLRQRVFRDRIRSEIPEKRGIVMYHFIDAHIARVLGTFQLLSTWAGELPWTERRGNGDYVFPGTFRSVYPGWLNILKFLGGSEFIRFFHLDYPLTLTDAHLDFFVGLVKALENQLRSELNVDQFYLVFAPASETSSRLIPLLDRAGIRSIDYSRWLVDRLTPEPVRIPHDGHPSAAYNRVFAPYLARDLLADEGKQR